MAGIVPIGLVKSLHSLYSPFPYARHWTLYLLPATRVNSNEAADALTAALPVLYFTSSLNSANWMMDVVPFILLSDAVSLNPLTSTSGAEEGFDGGLSAKE